MSVMPDGQAGARGRDHGVDHPAPAGARPGGDGAVGGVGRGGRDPRRRRPHGARRRARQLSPHERHGRRHDAEGDEPPLHGGDQVAAGAPGADRQAQHLAAGVQRLDAPLVHQAVEDRRRRRAPRCRPPPGQPRPPAGVPRRGRPPRARRRARRPGRRRASAGATVSTRVSTTIWASATRSIGRSTRAARAITSLSSTGSHEVRRGAPAHGPRRRSPDAVFGASPARTSCAPR